jgi:hypothetical protein
MVTEMLRVKRHLDKARLYVFPAMFLLCHVLDYYDKAWKQWTGKDEEAALGDWHPGKFCVIDHCYYTGSELGGKRALPWIAGKFNVAHEKKLLEDLALKLKFDPTLQSPYHKTPYSGTKKLFDDAERKYDDRSLGVKAKHGITNPWQRKTMGEQVAFVGKHAASFALAGAGVGAHIKADEALNVAAWLIDAAFSSTDVGLEEGVEGIDPGVHAYTKDIESQLDGSKMGEGAQDGLRKAAIHLWETSNVWVRIVDVNGGYGFAGQTCDEALEYLRQVYKIQHHLLKTQKYLKETIELVTKLAEKIDHSLATLTTISNAVFDVIDPFMRAHKPCDHGTCYRAAVHFSAT